MEGPAGGYSPGSRFGADSSPGSNLGRGSSTGSRLGPFLRFLTLRGVVPLESTPPGVTSTPVPPLGVNLDRFRDFFLSGE